MVEIAHYPASIQKQRLLLLIPSLANALGKILGIQKQRLLLLI